MYRHNSTCLAVAWLCLSRLANLGPPVCTGGRVKGMTVRTAAGKATCHSRSILQNLQP